MKELLAWLERTREVVKENLEIPSRHVPKATTRFYEGQLSILNEVIGHVRFLADREQED